MKQNEKYNDLTFIRETAPKYTPSGGKRRFGIFLCSCGVEHETAISPVKCGTVKSCGCVGLDKFKSYVKTTGEKRGSYKHGFFGSRFYSIWALIHARCEKPNNVSYRFYGARGIKSEYKDFLDFKEDMYDSYVEHVKKYGERQTTIDRIDSSQNYKKGNCRWSTYKEQARNRKNNTLLTIKGETKTLAEWVEVLKMTAYFVKKLARSEK